MRALARILSAVLVVCMVAGCGAQQSSDTQDRGERRERRREERERPPKDAAKQEGAAATATATQQDADKALFEQSCSKCHPVAKPEAYKGATPWKDIVAQMISEKGAQISPEDSAKIVAYLDKTYPRQ